MQTSEPKQYEREGYYWAWQRGGVLCDTEAEAKAMLKKMGYPGARVEKRYVRGAVCANETR